MDVPDSAVPYDLEHWEEDGQVVHPDRPVYQINVETGESVLYESGEKVYEGDIEGAIGYLEERWGEELPETASTVKVQAAINDGDWETDEQVAEYLL
ncbi:MAG: hypothetical protein ABEJ87_00920 [Candidatus Nanohalobium sp.]